jgi:hypothetical protein
MSKSKSMASGDLTITLFRVGSFRAGRHGDLIGEPGEKNWQHIRPQQKASVRCEGLTMLKNPPHSRLGIWGLPRWGGSQGY